MDAIGLLRHQVKQSYSWLELMVSDVSQEQANWQPPGTANSIGAVYAHLMITADVGFNSQLHGGMPLIASDWAGRVGLSEMYPAGDWGEWALRVRVDWDAFRGYARDVDGCVQGYLDSLSASELEGRVNMTARGLGIWKGLDVYNVHGIYHPRLHGGEIACLKGLQGGHGLPPLPFDEDQGPA